MRHASRVDNHVAGRKVDLYAINPMIQRTLAEQEAGRAFEDSIALMGDRVKVMRGEVLESPAMEPLILLQCLLDLLLRVWNRQSRAVDEHGKDRVRDVVGGLDEVGFWPAVGGSGGGHGVRPLEALAGV